MAADLPGLGTIVQVEISSSYTTIPQIEEFGWDGMENGERNPNTLDSTYVEKKPTILNCGELSLSILFDPNDATHKYIRDACKNKTTPINWKVKYADGLATAAAATVVGYVKQFSQSNFTVDGTVTADVVVALTSITSFADGSA